MVGTAYCFRITLEAYSSHASKSVKLFLCWQVIDIGARHTIPSVHLPTIHPNTNILCCMTLMYSH